jgi:hypothetical protein
MLKATLKRISLAVALLVILLFTVDRALAVSQCSWTGVVERCRQHTSAFINLLDKTISGYSSGYVPNGAFDQIYVDVRLQDRCKNADGSWQAWQQYGFNSSQAGNASHSGTASAQGMYQTCQYGHEYKQKSDHWYWDPYHNIDHWSYLTSN